MAKSSKAKSSKNIMESSSGESDSEVDAFTKLFMAKAKSVPLQKPEGTHGSESASSGEEASDLSSGDDSDGEEGSDYQRTRNRMSPSEDSGSSDNEESDSEHTRNAGGMAEDSASDSNDSSLSGGESKRARSRMSPSEGSESDTDLSDSDESSSLPEKSNTQEKESEDEGEHDDSDESMESDNESDGDVQPDIEALRKELADVPFEELQKLKQKIGVKAYNEAMHGIRGGPSKKSSLKRANKNRPMEVSSKKPVRRHRDIVSVKKKDLRDPRFDDMSGKYYETFFKNAYGFLSDVKEREKQTLLKKLKKEKDEEKKEQIQYLISRMNQQEAAEREKEWRLTQNKEIKKKEQELVREGKTPFHLKKGDRKKLELAEKFRELKRSGKVDKYLAKKRKKNASKEKRKLPNRQTVFA